MQANRPIEVLASTLRGQMVFLDLNLAEIHGVKLRAFNQAVKRNAEGLPEDFLFELTRGEILRRSRILTSLAKLKFSR